MRNYNRKTKKIRLSLWMTVILLFFVGQLFAQTVTFSFANAKMTDGSGGVGTTHYEVDVMLTTDADFKLGIGQFYFDYNTAAFGTTIEGSNLTINHPTGSETGYIMDTRVFGGAANFYNDLILANNTTSKVSIAWTQAQAASNLPAANVTVAGSPNLLMHITIEYVDNTQDPMITFDGALSDNLSYTAGNGPLGTGPSIVNITNDTYDSSGAVLANTWTGATNTDWDTATNWSMGAVPTGTSKVAINDVVNDPVASGPISVNEMTINSGAQLTVNGAVTNNSTIVVNSGGSFIAKTSVSGNVTYNRTIGSTNWHFISSPVNDQDVDAFVGTEGLAAGTGNNRGLSSYNNSTPGWTYYQAGAAGTGNFPQGEGRALKLAASGDIAFTGTMPVSNVSVSITSNVNGFNLIGNPYPSFIPVNTSADAINNILSINTSSLVQETLWFWNQGTSSYDQINQASASRFVAPAQGFFVQSNGNNTFKFTEAMQSHQTDNFQRNTNTRPKILLSLTNGTNTKVTDIFYIEGTTTGWDNGYDSTIFGGANHPFAIYTHLVSEGNGEKLGIQSLPPDNYESMVIPLGVNATSGTSITISAASVNLPVDLNVYLEDRTNGVYTLLDDTSEFTTTLSEDLDGIGRFFLHTSSSALSVGDEELTSVSMYTSSKDNLRIVGIESGQARVKIYNILGNQVLNTSFTGNRVNDIRLSNFKTGVYIVQLKTRKGSKSKKLVIQ